MPIQCKKIVLSRFFNNNVELIADMCPLCYDECVDVRILSVNLDFLKQTRTIDDINFRDFKFLNNSHLPVILKDERGTPGFSKEDVNTSLNCINRVNRIINTEERDIAKLERELAKLKAANQLHVFCGFSMEEVRQSSKDHEMTVKAYEQERYKIYKRVKLRAVHNIYNSRATKNVLRKNIKGNVDSKKKSKYFKIEINNDEASSKKNKISIKDCSKLVKDVKVEKCEHSNDSDVSYHVKTEPDGIDYESEYFKVVNSNRSASDSKKVKTVTYLVPKEESFGGFQEKKVPVWVPPRSPHNLIEEVLYHDPWALLIATIFLNRTSCMCARPYVFWFLRDNPDPFKVLEKFPGEFEKYFVNLGLHRTRSVQVWRMSHDFVYKNWSNVKDLYGIGEYGHDAFRMFCLGDFSVEPKDRFLRIYKAWYEKVEMKKGPY